MLSRALRLPPRRDTRRPGRHRTLLVLIRVGAGNRCCATTGFNLNHLCKLEAAAFGQVHAADAGRTRGGCCRAAFAGPHPSHYLRPGPATRDCCVAHPGHPHPSTLAAMRGSSPQRGAAVSPLRQPHPSSMAAIRGSGPQRGAAVSPIQGNPTRALRRPCAARAHSLGLLRCRLWGNPTRALWRPCAARAHSLGPLHYPPEALVAIADLRLQQGRRVVHRQLRRQMLAAGESHPRLT